LSDAGSYDVVITGPAGFTCPSVISGSTVLAVTPTVGTPTTITAAGEPTCQLTNGTTTSTYSSTVSNSTGFNWSISNPAAGSIHPSTGVMTWANGFTGSVDIQVTASGCNGPSAQVVRTVNIAPTVGTPTAITASGEPSCQLTNGTTTTTYSTTASNSSGFNWSISNLAAGSINPTTGVMTWANGFSGSVNIQVTANGCNGPSAQVVRSVNITPTVGTPTAITAVGEPSCQLTNGTTTTTYSTTATNSTGFNWSISNPAAGSIDASTGVMTWNNGFSGAVNIQVTANGCNGPSSQVVRTVNITPTVGTPTAITAVGEPTCQLTNGTTTTTYSTSASNSTGFNWSISNTAAGSIDASTGVMTWTNGFNGSVDIRATANGCNGPSSQVSRTVNITPTVGTPSTITIASGVEPSCQVAIVGSTTGYSTGASNATGYNWSLSNPAAGSINSSGVVTWANGFNGSVDIRVTANGCNGPSAQVVRTVVVTPTVGIPVFTLGASSSYCQAAGTVTYTANATNNTGITYSLDAASLAAGNSINTASGAVTYVASWTGTTVITATATGCNGPRTATHTVAINPIVGTPVFALGAASNRCQGASSVTYSATSTNATSIVYSLDAASLAAGNTINSSTGLVNFAAGWAGTSTITATAMGCNGPNPNTASHAVSVEPLPVGGTANNTSGVIFSCAGNNGGNIELTGQQGVVSRWESSTNGGASWTPIASTATSIIYDDITTTTWYRAVVNKALCPSITDYSAHAVVSVVPHVGAGALSVATAPDPAIICSGSVVLTANGIGTGSQVGALTGGEFDDAGVNLDGPGLWRKTLIANWDSQDKVNVEGSTNNANNSAFNLTNGPKTFLTTGGCTPITYNNNPLGGQPNNNKFMMVAGPNTSSLESPIFNLVGLSTASMNWWESYTLTAGASIRIEISTDGGATYNTTLRTITGAVVYGNPINFSNTTLNLDAYVGLSNLRVKFTYTGTMCSSWGLEKATITRGIVPAVYTWSMYDPIPPTGTPVAHYLNVFQNPSVTVTPPPNTTTAPVTYNYSLQSSTGGCLDSIAVTINPTPTATIGPPITICSGTAISIPVGGNVPGSVLNWTRNNTTNVTGIANSGSFNFNGSSFNITGTPVNNTTVPQTVTFTVTPSYSNGGVSCPGAPVLVDIIVQPPPTVTITGSYDCTSGMANLTLTVAGNGPVSGVLQPGNIAFSGTAPGTITIPPMAITASTTYNVSSLTVGSCAASGAGLGSPLTISTLGTGPAGLWTGAVDTDWFNKCNWANYQVPDNTVDVTIDNSAVRICVIDPDTSPYAAAYNDIARSRNITISNNQLQFASDAGKLSYLYAAGNLTINGATGYLNMLAGGQIDLAGNWTNNRGTLGFEEGLGTIQLMGTTQQTVQTVAGATEAFHNLIINNTFNNATHTEVVMNNPATIDGVFTLIDGHVHTTAANLLTVINPAVSAVVGGSVNSYVNGPMARNTNSTADYNYPVGKPNGPYTSYRPAIIAPSSTAPTVYRTEYLVQATNPTALAPRTMLGILNTEYWDISRTGGTSDAIVKLNYINPNNAGHWADAGPCFDCNVAIAKTYPTPPPPPPAPPGTPPPTWYFTNYINTSSGFNMTLPETRWNGDNGLIWSKLLDNFGLFTFAYDYNVVLGQTQLPVVKLNSFNAKLAGRNGELDWNIAGISNLESVVLEHSTDGVQFSKLAAFGNRLYGLYTFTHNDLSSGKHYYRLILQDKQRQRLVSEVKMLEVAGSRTIIHDLPITVIRTLIPVDVESAMNQQVAIRIITMNGVVLTSSTSKLEEGANRIGVQVPYLSQGIYLIRVQTQDGVSRTMKFMKE
jgi:hypothetical protein